MKITHENVNARVRLFDRFVRRQLISLVYFSLRTIEKLIGGVHCAVHYMTYTEYTCIRYTYRSPKHHVGRNGLNEPC